ncbi:MAG: 4-hydroxy-tetrahydrodipicolinate reductase [Deltaproteobacteria bacterium]|nr:4-hydroxy-tetrahydrodipicolinate reductase [Deltaproteobacteria bacterium]
MIRVAIVGGAGRMGRALVAAVLESPACTLTGVTEHAGHALIGQDVGTALGHGALGVTFADRPHAVMARCDVVIDFTAPEASVVHAACAAEEHVPLVIGTTGFSTEQLTGLRKTAAHTAILLSPNMSIGVNLFWHVAERLANVCGGDYAIRIDETHHVHKKDAPSGTAKKLRELVTAAAGRTPESVRMQSYREGEVIGDHTITFESPGDVITIRHQAKERVIFARGAVAAAQWLVGKPAGRYAMADMLGLTKP